MSSTTASIDSPIIYPKRSGFIIGITVGIIGGFFLIIAIAALAFVVMYFRRKSSYELREMKKKETGVNITQFHDVFIENITLERKLGEGSFRYPFFVLIFFIFGKKNKFSLTNSLLKYGLEYGIAILRWH